MYQQQGTFGPAFFNSSALVFLHGSMRIELFGRAVAIVCVIVCTHILHGFLALLVHL
jgi:hypothetical protein